MITDIETDRRNAVANALSEDVGTGDITAQLIDPQQQSLAHIICRENAIICGTQWVDEVFKQLDSAIAIEWHVKDGQQVEAEQLLAILKGNSRQLLTGERAALNFLQTLSATATQAGNYAQLLKDSNIKILDTRKTIPGLRLAQKYAVSCGGCHNHRIGLFDAFLIKENHIASCGGIAASLQTARALKPELPVEIEVEDLQQLQEALDERADIVMLDNFSNKDIGLAISMRESCSPTTKLEVSGNIDAERLAELSSLGIDYVSIGALTKHCRAIDLSMRFE